MFKNFKKAFILAPHTDDGELGCGGTIQKLIKSNVDVYYIAFSIAEESVPDGFLKNQLEYEVKEATKVLGIPEKNVIVYKYPVRKFNYLRQDILEDLIKLRNNYYPDIVFTPSLSDIHQDHKVIAEESLRAFKGSTILGYELIWNNFKSSVNCFVSLTIEELKIKAKALSKYKTQKRRSYMNEEFIFALAKVKGIQVGVEYAETFEVIRWIIK